MHASFYPLLDLLKYTQLEQVPIRLKLTVEMHIRVKTISEEFQQDNMHKKKHQRNYIGYYCKLCKRMHYSDLKRMSMFLLDKVSMFPYRY
jgi:hypothetical protein